MEGILNFINSLEGGVERLLLILAILVLTILLAKIIRKTLTVSFDKASKILKVDPTHYRFLKHFSTAMIYVFGLTAIVYTVPSLRTLSVSLLAGAGVLAVVIGFASQAAFSNIISGIFIVIFKPFRVGDRIKIGVDLSGVVEDITLRHTVVRTFENKRVIIPNSNMSNERIENSNFGEDKVCRFVEFQIGFDANIDKAKKIMREESEKHPLCQDYRSVDEKKKGDPIVPVRVLRLTDFSVVLRAWVWAKDQASAFQMGCDLNESIKKRFDKEKIEIPYPYRAVVSKRERRY